MASFLKSMLGLTKPKKLPLLAAPVLDDGAEQRRRRLALQRMTMGGTKPKGSRSGTLLTSPRGLTTAAPTARKSLLGE